MVRKKRHYEDDDGRTVADMSGIGRQPLFRPSGSQPRRGEGWPAEERGQGPREGEQEPLTREQRRWYILGALKAALLIAGVFLVGLGLTILLMALLWT